MLCALLGIGLAACYQPTLTECLVTCEAATGCPSGYACGGNGYCHRADDAESDCPGLPDPDAAVPDAERDGDTDGPDAMPPLAGLRGLAAGEGFTCGLDADDHLWCWGENRSGQIGQGVPSLRILEPARVGGTRTWSSVTGGGRSACGVDAISGAAYCWGGNDRGQLGRGGGVGGESALVLPVMAVPGQGAWSSLSGWYEHVCGINAGRVFCWGAGSTGQLGNDASGDSSMPVQAGLATDWVQVATGIAHSCGIRLEGTARNVYCWGHMDALGNGATGSLDAPGDPTLHPTGRNWVSVAAGFNTTCAIDEDGDLLCWGDNGPRIILTSPGSGVVQTPAVVENSRDWHQVSLGYKHACARAGTEVRCWADSTSGQSGVHPQTDGMHTIAGEWSEVSTGSFGHHSCGVRGGGAFCWGYNGAGQLGTGLGGDMVVPSQVIAAAEPAGMWTQVVAGVEVTCAIADSDGAIWCWGFDTGVLMGLGDQAQPRRLDALGTGWATVDADFGHACAIKAADGALWCWGSNTVGQLGTTPGGSPSEVFGGGAWRDVGVGITATCAIKTDGTLWCWGSDDDGLLGDPGSDDARTQPRQVVDATNGWESISVGQSHACATRSDGSAACWGVNNQHAVDELDLNTTIESPRDLPALAAGDWVVLDAATGSDRHSTGIAGQTRLAWGNAYYGRLGLGMTDMITTPSSRPTEVANWTAVANGGDQACGLRDGGQLWCWGYSVNAPIADGSYAGAYEPVRIGSASGWIDVSVGTWHSCAIDGSKQLFCWGQGFALQLGSGLGMSATPVPVVPLQP